MADPFLVVGSMKCGTTSIHELLRRHPDVDLVADKEESLLALDCNRFRAAVRRSDQLVAGEVTAGYMQAPLMPQPIDEARSLGDQLRVVAILRDPVRRAISHWEHWSQAGRENRTIDDALADRGGPYVSFSRYHSQLLPWLELAGRGGCLVMRTEDLALDPGGVAGQLFRFLGLPPLPAGYSTVHENARSDRIIATGWRGHVRESRLYRRVLRPVLPRRARRRFAVGHRTATGVGPTLLAPGTRAAFEQLVADDLRALRSVYPHLGWSQ